MKYVSCFNKKSTISRTLDKFLVSNRCLKNLFRFLFERQNWLKCERNDTPTAQMCDFITYCYFTFIRNMNFTADCSSGGIGNRASGYLTRTVFQNIDDSNIQRLKSRILIFEQKRLISRRNWENIHRWDHAYNVHVGWNVGRTIHHSPPPPQFFSEGGYQSQTRRLGEGSGGLSPPSRMHVCLRFWPLLIMFQS